MEIKKNKTDVRLSFTIKGELKDGKKTKKLQFESKDFLNEVLPPFKFEKQKQMDDLRDELFVGDRLKRTSFMKQKSMIDFINHIFEYGKHVGYWSARQSMLDNAHRIINNTEEFNKRMK